MLFWSEASKPMTNETGADRMFFFLDHHTTEVEEPMERVAARLGLVADSAMPAIVPSVSEKRFREWRMMRWREQWKGNDPDEGVIYSTNNWSTVLKVPHRLREVNENAYIPQLISIGPYHHGKPHLEVMEEYKKQFLRIIDGKGQKLVDRCLQAMNLEQVCEFYSPSLNLMINQQKFGEMIRDGCFVVRLLCRQEQNLDPIFKLKWIQTALLHDFLLLENQLPFFMLVKLYQMTEDAPTDVENLDQMTEDAPTDVENLDQIEYFAFQAFRALSQLLPGPKNWSTPTRPAIKHPGQIKHLLSFVHDNWSPKNYYEKKRAKLQKKRQGDEERGVITEGDRSFSRYWKFIFCGSARDKEDVRKGLAEWQSIRCSTELEEAGIRFVNVGVDSNGNSGDPDVKSLFDISFKGSTLKIPTFVVGDNTERLFRNLIAYELYNEGSTYVMDYVTFMDNLINSAKDVQLLRFSGVIENMLGDDEAVAQMINRLRDHVTLCGDTFYYEEIFVGLKEHCARRWNISKAKLRHDYFNSPWAHISFLAALIITIATIGQFVTAVIPLVNK